MQRMPAFSRTDDLWPQQMSRKRKRDEYESEMLSWFRNLKHKIFGKSRNEDTVRKQPRVDEGDCNPRHSSTRLLTSTPKQKQRSSHSWFKLKDKQLFSELIQKHLIDESDIKVEKPQAQGSTQTDNDYNGPLVIDLQEEEKPIIKEKIENDNEKKFLRERCQKSFLEDDVTFERLKRTVRPCPEAIGPLQVLNDPVRLKKEPLRETIGSLPEAMGPLSVVKEFVRVKNEPLNDPIGSLPEATGPVPVQHEDEPALLSQQSIHDSQNIPPSLTIAKCLYATKSKYLDIGWLNELRASIIGGQEQEKKASQEHDESLKKVREETFEQKEKLDKVLKKRINDRELIPSFYSFYISEIDDQEETEEVEITDEMNEKIDKLLKVKTLEDYVVNNLKYKDLQTLKNLNWLNDEVINEYFALIEKEANSEKANQVKCFSTFFYKNLKDRGFMAVRRWTKKFDIFSYSLVLIPLHLQIHWTLISIRMEDKTIHFYDSMKTDNSTSSLKHLQAILNYLESEYKDKKGKQLNVDEWRLIEETKIPEQLNGSDCGMFCCKYAYYLSKRKRFSFNQSLMPFFRRRMIYELVTQKLL